MTARGQFLQNEVLNALKACSGPLSAYDILNVLREGEPKMAPNTVYRALDALMKQNRVHRIESLNAFVICQCEGHDDASILSICDDCGAVDESTAPELLKSLSAALGTTGFSAQRHVIEVHGTCGSCGEGEA